MPVGTDVWWTEASAGREWVVTNVSPAGGGSEVTLILQTNRMTDAGLPRARQRACFSQLNTRDQYEIYLPYDIPWTHRPKERQSSEADLDSEAA
jgi:hypothetical protein